MKDPNSIPSQATAILNYMQEGRKISPLLALNLFGCMRLGARIYELKQLGHEIETRMVDHDGVRFAEYHLAHKLAAVPS